MIKQYSVWGLDGNAMNLRRVFSANGSERIYLEIDKDLPLIAIVNASNVQDGCIRVLTSGGASMLLCCRFGFPEPGSRYIIELARGIQPINHFIQLLKSPNKESKTMLLKRKA